MVLERQVVQGPAGLALVRGSRRCLWVGRRRWSQYRTLRGRLLSTGMISPGCSRISQQVDRLRLRRILSRSSRIAANKPRVSVGLRKRRLLLSRPGGLLPNRSMKLR